MWHYNKIMATEKPRESLTIRLRPQDADRLGTIRRALGIQSDTEAVRYALAAGAVHATETGPVVSRDTAPQ